MLSDRKTTESDDGDLTIYDGPIKNNVARSATLALDHALDHAKNWLERLDSRPVAPRTDLASLRDRLGGVIPDRGMSPECVIDELVALSESGHMGSASGRFFAWVIGGSLTSALAADWLVSTWDQNAAIYACGPSVSVIEETAGAWMLELLDLPREASFAFTTGCQFAHVTSLATARHSLLMRQGWDVEEEGLFDAPRLTVLTTAQHHESIDRAVRFLGVGRKSIKLIPMNENGQATAAGLSTALEDTDGPTIVVLNAADLNIGACDDFSELIPIAHAADAWVHIDGAFGLFARASRSKRHLLNGVELADSWATDAHKWLNVPFDCGIAIIRDSTAHRAAMTVSTSYISAYGDARDQIDWNPEWSRRARGVPVYAALKELGRDGVEALVDRCCAYCDALVFGIGALQGARVVAAPTLNQGLVRFEQPDATDEENDARTAEVIDRINETGEAFFSGVDWKGKRAMRVSVINWRTTLADVERTIAAVSTALAQRSGS
jgi:glutamate/tyrosine decarboxylase-like PLP-dependent enzyme